MSETTIAPEQIELEIGYLGKGIPLKEAKRLVQGHGIFVDDVKRHGMGYVHFVRSPYAHARIVSVDVSQAEALEGAYGTLTPDEVVRLSAPLPQLSTPPGNQIKDYALAVGRVRHIGDPVVAVVAATRELARDAADLVEVEYEPLDVLVDARKAQDADAPVLHEDAGTNVVWSGTYDWGDIDGALKAADKVIKVKELHFNRFSSTPVECCAAVAEWDRASEQWTVFTNHHVLGINAVYLSAALGVGIDRLRFITHDIGGGFGNKATQYTYLVVCCLLARKLGRPVKWTEWRTDHHTTMSHGLERWFQDIEVAVEDDGTMLGFKCGMIDDAGAFPRFEPLGGVIWAQCASGPYRWRNIRAEYTQVVTNKAPSGPNRGYSVMQHLWLMERLIDIVSHELGIDPIEIRKRNFVKADEMPYETPNGCVLDSGDYARSLDIALELIGYESVRARQAVGGSKLIGIGIGSTIDSGTNNMGQSRLINPELRFSGNHGVATIRLGIFGEIVLALGSQPQGQGHETVSAQVAADILGVTPDDINVRPGFDTDRNAHGGLSATWASSFAVIGLSAVKGAAEKLAHEIRRLAAALLGAESPDDIILEGGVARTKDDLEAALSFRDLGGIVNANLTALPAEVRDVTLNCRDVWVAPFELPDAERKFGKLALTYASQVHVCMVEIDPETGVVEIVDHAEVDDCGVRINPQIVEGQVHGATAHSIGGALYETYAYDEYGQLLTANFYDYHVPHALDLPDFKTASIESPSPFTPLGAKGMGEGGGGAIHSVCAAIQDALRRAGSRAVVYDSFNPPERVWRMLRNPEESGALVEVVSQ